MRIVIDARMMSPRWTGIGLYSRQLIAELQQLDHTNEYIVLVDDEMFKTWAPTAPNFRKVLASYKVYGFGEQLSLPWKLRGLKPDVVHFLHFNVPVFYRSRRVVTIHDTTMIDFSLSPGGLAGALKYGIMHPAMLLAYRAATTATQIITPSQGTKNALVKRYGARLAKRMTVTHEAATYTEPLEPRALPTNQPLVLYVGNFYPYKNIGVVIQAWPSVIAQHPGAKLRLIGATPRFSDRVKAQINQLGIGTSVEMPGFVSDLELAGAYRRATLFVFPSLSEGFGLPPLEAMVAGVPVIAAKASCLPEVLGDAAVFADPAEPEDWAAQINGLLDAPQRLAELQQHGYNRLRSFSWAKMAAETVAVYKAVKPV